MIVDLSKCEISFIDHSYLLFYKVSQSALNEMSRLRNIEEQYPIKIQEYLRTEVTYFHI